MLLHLDVDRDLDLDRDLDRVKAVELKLDPYPLEELVGLPGFW